MSKIVNHSKRKSVILSKALSLFASLGYPQVTYSQIAENCGLPRTTLYQYFPTKRNILDAAISQLITTISNEVRQTFIQNQLESPTEQLRLLLHRSLEICIENHALLKILVEYLMTQIRQGENTQKKIHRHTVLFRRSVRNILMDGIRKGEFLSVDPTITEETIFALMESEVLRILFTCQENQQEIFRCCDNILRLISKEPRG